MIAMTLSTFLLWAVLWLLGLITFYIAARLITRAILRTIHEYDPKHEGDEPKKGQRP